MVTNPADYVKTFADIGTEYFTFHAEATPHMHRLVQEIKAHGMKAGISLNPSTPVSMLEDIASDLDMILIMSVNPGLVGSLLFLMRFVRSRRQKNYLLIMKIPKLLLKLTAALI